MKIVFSGVILLSLYPLNSWHGHVTNQISLPEEQIKCVFDNNKEIILLISS